MPESLRYIIIGTGGQGAVWCKLTLPQLLKSRRAVPVAAVDSNIEALNNASQFLGLPAGHCFTDPTEAFETRTADFCILVTPPSTHEKLIELALIYDMDVLVDAPLADSMEASSRIFRKVAAAEKKVAVSMGQRYDQDKQTLEYMAQSRDYGPVNYVVGRFTYNHRRRGSWGRYRHEMIDPLLIEGAVHHFDIFRAVTGSNARSIYANAWNPLWGQFRGDSTALVTIEMENGARCFYEGALANASTLNGWNNEYFRVECADGTLELDRRRLRLLQGDALVDPAETPLPLLEQEAWGNVLSTQLFCDWMLDSSKKHPTRLTDNIQVQAMVFAAIQAAHTQKAVDVQPYMKQQISATKGSV